MLFMSGWQVGNCTVKVVSTTVQDAVRTESVPIFACGGHIDRRVELTNSYSTFRPVSWENGTRFSGLPVRFGASR